MTGLAVSIGLVIMWSSGFIGAELGTQEASTDTLLMWRFLAATALLGVGWLIFRRRRLPLRTVGEQALIGLLSQGVYLGCIVGAIELGVPAGTTALIAAVQPLLAGTLAGPLLGERVSARRWIGLGAGLGGVALVVSDDLTPGGAPTAAFLLPFAGMAALLAASVLERRSRNPIGLADALPIHSLVSAAALTVPALATGAAQPPGGGAFWFAVGWVVLLSTLGGYGCYWLSLRRHGVTHTSVLIYLTPPTTAGWAHLMFGHSLSSWSVLGMAVCLGSVIAVTVPHRAVRHRDRVEA